MSQTVQKQQSSNTDSEETENLELGEELDKSWSGLYNRWIGQLEKDFEEDPTQKRKLWLHGSIAGSIPILNATLPVTTLLPLFLLSMIWWMVLYKKDLSRMVSSTVLTSLYISGLIFQTIPFLLGTIYFYLRYR